MAFHLMEYVVIAGPPKQILTDRGSEECNQIVTELISHIGTDHILAAGYNPQTNGKVEKFNDTLVIMLRKNCENNTDNWPNALPACLLAYRSRIHPATGYSPYELLFGIKMNTFGDWCADPDIDVQLAYSSNRSTSQRFATISFVKNK